jgi:hypothetical protein
MKSFESFMEKLVFSVMQAKKHVNERILGIFQHKTEMGSTSCHTKISCHDDMMDAKSDPQHA